MVISPMPEPFIEEDAEAPCWYFHGSLESVAHSRQSSAASPTPSSLDDFYGNNLDGDGKVGGVEGGNIASGRCKEVPSKFGRNH